MMASAHSIRVVGRRRRALARTGRLALALGLMLAAGCSRHNPNSPTPEEPPPLFQDGKGLKLPAETQTSLGLQLGAAGPRTLRPQRAVRMQIFERSTNASGTVCLRASGFVPSNLVARMPEARVMADLGGQTPALLEGRLLRVESNAQAGLGQAELVVEFCGGPALPVGSFVQGLLALGPVHAACAVPRTALVRAAWGDFVYVVEDGFFKRVRVQVGVEDPDWAEVQAGLEPGTRLVASGAEALWLLELSQVGGMANLR